MYLASRGIKSDDFLADLHVQAQERARQSLALNAIANKLNLEATEADVEEEFKSVGKDYKKQMDQFKKNGQMPAIRESIRRSKAVKWLVENASVEVVDEVAQANKDAEKKAKAPKKTSKKSADKASSKAAEKKTAKTEK